MIMVILVVSAVTLLVLNLRVTTRRGDVRSDCLHPADEKPTTRRMTGEEIREADTAILERQRSERRARIAEDPNRCPMCWEMFGMTFRECPMHGYYRK